MSDDLNDLDKVRGLAEILGLPLSPEHLEETARCWTQMAPHRDRVTVTPLGPHAEPAALFRP